MISLKVRSACLCSASLTSRWRSSEGASWAPQRRFRWVGGGRVVGAATALARGGRGVTVVFREARDRLGLAASGTNSGILHTGFDSPPGELETRLILRSAELREEVLERLRIPVRRCGAL